MLASSSSGNATFIATSRTRILVDAGLSRKELCRRLAEIGETPEALDGIVITHEHSDHVCGLVRFVKKFNTTVYMTNCTAPAIEWEDATPRLETFQAGTAIAVGDIEVETFTVPHDAADPVGFCFKSAGVRIGFVTDLGYMPDSIKFHLNGVDALMLEANHDLEMLKVGPYPWSVKQRVMGRKGHLSNEVVSDYIKNDMNSSTAMLLLGHLSENNNFPGLVHLMATQALQSRSLGTQLVVLDPGKQSAVFQF